MDPKPIMLTQVTPASYTGNQDPQPMVVVTDGAILDVTAITGYDSGATQTLTHVSGVLTWVTA